MRRFGGKKRKKSYGTDYGKWPRDRNMLEEEEEEEEEEEKEEEEMREEEEKEQKGRNKKRSLEW